MAEPSGWITLTWGFLPTEEQFRAQFDRLCPDGRYNIKLGPFDSEQMEGFPLGDGDYTCDQLWSAIGQVHEAWVKSAMIEDRFDKAMDLISSIMVTLEIEWI